MTFTSFSIESILLIIGAYICGATPFAIIIAKLNKIDLRSVGSGNPGATNVSRALGKKWGYLCFLLDVAKGLLPVLFTGMLIAQNSDSAVPTAFAQLVWILVAAGCVMGHVFSFWLKFKGGKGVATSLGAVLGIFPFFTYAGLIAFAVWVIAVLYSRYVSLASIIAAIAFVPAMLLVNYFMIGYEATCKTWPLILFATIMIVLVVLRHRSNIKRLLAGTENKIKSKS